MRIALEGWRDREGPRYRRIAEAVAEAVQNRLVAAGDRLPAERPLADALAVSRGTVVRCLDELEAAGIVERLRGSGTFVKARPAWTDTPRENPVSALLRRQMAGGGESIDLSQAVPAGVDHLPGIPGLDVLAGAEGHGLEPAGSIALRTALADHLTRRLNLPTDAEQLIVTSGAQHALTLVAAAVVPQGRTVVTGCPTYQGLPGALAGRGGRLLGRHLPAWRPEPPAAGLSLWVTLPVTDSETYAHLASRYGVIVAPGAAHCVDGRHHAGIRLSIAESPHVLEAAVDRLAAAWEHHTRDLAAGRSRVAPGHAVSG
ncbi:aminotransferase class I/II-fold pyridoxal phosphate-dependent enzyme [Streptosporangium sp. NPDC051023]|uniref:aminotransferase class I/II-fold pyridoxal phosphate-dependent enzyme n=1 Tax=Streptosporangium sp. NPDC051023 TaxID=3155410 RepID=UPI00344D533C